MVGMEEQLYQTVQPIKLITSKNTDSFIDK